MNNDPVYQRLREMSWRRALTEAERAELRAWLTAHPEAAADIEAEAALTHALANSPDAPAPSNFTTRVMAAIQQDEAAQARSKAGPLTHWWRVLVPRFAVATVIIIGIVFAYRHNANVRRIELAQAAQQLSEARILSDATVIEDFETILCLNPVETIADENLLAMSDDLLALNR